MLYKEEHEKATKEFGISVVITLPGIAKYQKKLGLSNDALSEKEQRIIRIIGVRRAIARGGVLIELPCLNDSIFQNIMNWNKDAKLAQTTSMCGEL